MKKIAIGLAVMTGLCFGANINIDQNNYIDLKGIQIVEAAPNEADYYTTTPWQLIDYASKSDGELLVGYNVKFDGPMLLKNQNYDGTGFQYMVFGDLQNLYAPVVVFAHDFDPYINKLGIGHRVTIYGQIAKLDGGYIIVAHHIKW